MQNDSKEARSQVKKPGCPTTPTERIRQMERRLDRATTALTRLKKALRQYEEAQADIQALSLYYGSQEWKHDFAQDEAGLLPKDLKRGVLSEDAIWNLLEENRELGAQMAANTVGLGPQGDG